MRDMGSNAKSAMALALRGKSGRSFWRSLEELSKTAEFDAFVTAEFPAFAPNLAETDRRSLLKMMAASFALAGLTGCDAKPDEAALPYVTAPDGVTVGKPQWYATAVTMGGYAQPVLGKTYSGRPVKLEGNPDHPATQGATDPFLQAALLDLYDPARSQAPRHMGRETGWNTLDAATTARKEMLDAAQGDGFRLLTGTVTSPTLSRQIDEMLRRWPKAGWHVLEPVSDDLQLEAARLVFGRPLQNQLRPDRAEAVVSLDDDWLGPGPRQASLARLWSERRRAFQGGDGACRLLVTEPTPSLTGAMAESRLIASSARISALAQAIARSIGMTGADRPDLSPPESAWVEAAAALLTAHPGRSLLTIGAQYRPEIQALGYLINEKLGNLGLTLRVEEPVAALPSDGGRSIDALAEDMSAGHVKTLVIIGANPAYATPADLAFADTMAKVEFTLHAGLYYDETAAASQWHAPLQHDLETWSDAKALDGTAGILQPLVQPFFGGRSTHTILAGLYDTETGAERGDARRIVQATWRAVWGGSFADRWKDALYKGYIAESRPAAPTPVSNRDIALPALSETEGLSVVLRPDPTIWDGRFANNVWLQELPKPLTKVTWGNVIMISPQLAKERRLENGDMVEVSADRRSITGPVWVMPGQEARTLTVFLGYGRQEQEGPASGSGYNAYRLRGRDRLWHMAGATLTATGEKTVVATTQTSQGMDGFDFVRTVTAADIRKPEHPAGQQPSFYPDRKWSSPSWGMSIDLDLCIGCSACITACDAENNIPVVGKDLVAQGRQMHWLRVDQYYEGEAADPKIYSQPVPCMHCEQAPCEMGCPVNATVHSSDGLNLQVYNRCIGTRTCSAYCPYKVRRFNWFDYTGADPKSIQAMRNPDVTVRNRGVMEKCTFCVQRIREARIQADIEKRPVRDGEVVTACQQACPTKAIVFGDITDINAEVARRKASGRDYSLLEEVNTRPRTTYLAKIEDGDAHPAKEGQTG
jgi:molybdopterin-containing oxidoreductase family iron-sulfur binding subunit